MSVILELGDILNPFAYAIRQFQLSHGFVKKAMNLLVRVFSTFILYPGRVATINKVAMTVGLTDFSVHANLKSISAVSYTQHIHLHDHEEGALLSGQICPLGL